MTVHERIAEAMKVIAEIDFNKSGRVSGGASYNFIPIGQILQAVRKAHAKAGLFLTIGQLEYDTDHGEGLFTQDKWTKARGHCEVTINGADGDSVSFVVPFNVQDNSDKLDNKIVTNIERQAYRVIYAIDEGDGSDPESEWHEDQVTASPDKFFGNPKTPAKQESKKKWDPKSFAQPADAERDKLIEELTDLIMEGGSDMNVISSMLNNRAMADVPTEELKAIYEAVHPFEPKGAGE